MDRVVVSTEEIIKNVNVKKKSGADILDYFEKLLHQGAFTEAVLCELIEKEIALGEIAHLPLPDEVLLKLLQKDSILCAEAGFTLIDNALSNTVSVEKFHDTFVKCCRENVCDYIFRKMLTILNLDALLCAKFHDAVQTIKQTYDTASDIYGKALQYENYLLLLQTADEDLIARLFQKKNFVYYLAISQNDNSPDCLLSELTELKGMKFAGNIRNNAKQTLARKKGLPR